MTTVTIQLLVSIFLKDYFSFQFPIMSSLSVFSGDSDSTCDDILQMYKLTALMYVNVCDV